MMKIGKTFHVHAGHRLPNHPGLCKNLHGHTYHIAIIFRGDPDPGDGMIIDYADLKRIINNWIKEPMDHAMILHDRDEKVIRFCQDQGFKMLLLPDPPTAENIGKWISGIMLEALDQLSLPIALDEVRIQETPSSLASIFP